MVTDFEKALSVLEIGGFGLQFRLVSLEKLIVLKRAAGRPKDFPIIAELQRILDRKKKV
jgi:predicted nucleotidyltransferase